MSVLKNILAVIGIIWLVVLFFGGVADLGKHETAEPEESLYTVDAIDETAEEYVARKIAESNARIEDWLNSPRWKGKAWYGSVVDIYWRKPRSGIAIELRPPANGQISDRVARSVLLSAFAYLDHSGEDFSGLIIVNDGSRELVGGMREWNGHSPWIVDMDRPVP